MGRSKRVLETVKMQGNDRVMTEGGAKTDAAIYRKNVVWNVAAGVINAAEAVIVLALVSRWNHLSDAGMLTLAFSIANLLLSVGKFGIRNFQIVHDGKDYSFRTFFAARMITVALMVLISFGYVFYYFVQGRYTAEKSAVIFLVCLWYAVEAFEDVFAGKYQADGRLDIGCKAFTVRWICMLVVFALTDMFCRNVLAAVLAALLAGLFAGAYLPLYTCFRYKGVGDTQKELGLKRLLWSSMPLCISAFLCFYMGNIPKYAIDAFLGDEMQAVYGYLSMPVSAVPLLCSFIYQPQLMFYVMEWQEHRVYAFVHRMIRQLLVTVLIQLFCLGGAYFLGIPVLSGLYNKDLTVYKMHFLVLIFGSGFSAVGAFLSNMLTIIDEQGKVMAGYFVLCALGYAAVDGMVEKYQMAGAVWGYTIISILSTVVFGVPMICMVYKKMRLTADVSCNAARKGQGRSK